GEVGLRAARIDRDAVQTEVRVEPRVLIPVFGGSATGRYAEYGLRLEVGHVQRAVRRKRQVVGTGWKEREESRRASRGRPEETGREIRDRCVGRLRIGRRVDAKDSPWVLIDDVERAVRAELHSEDPVRDGGILARDRDLAE